MAKRTIRRDVNQIAASIVEQTTREKNPAAVALGRLGGLKGGKARAQKLSASARRRIARKAAAARWKQTPQIRSGDLSMHGTANPFSHKIITPSKTPFRCFVSLPVINKEGIAIIGIGCRFPGGVNDTESFWKLLVEGREAVSDVPPDRWNVERFFDAEPGLPGKSIARRGGFLEGIDQFDPQFFGISPREAPYVDPQHRLLLETAWEAIEDAGLVLDLEKGTDIGVFVGISHSDYQGIQHTVTDRAGISAHTSTGTAHSIA